MTVVHFSAVKGRPIGETKGSGNTYTWVAWWNGEPVYAPFTTPDAFGGAHKRADVPWIVQMFAPKDAQPEWLPCRWAQEWRDVQRGGREARAEQHAQREREFEERQRQAREYAADFRPWYEYRARAWVAYRDSLTSPGTRPDWATLLGLSWPAFTESELAAAWKARAFEAHPDRGGSHDAFVALEAARRAALIHLGAP